MPDEPRKPNIILFMSDDVGWGDLGLLRRWREPRCADSAPRPAGRRGAAVHVVLRAAELHAGSGRGDDRSAADPQWHDDGVVPGSGRWSPGRRVDGGERAEAGRATAPCQIGKWHLGEADYSMPTAHGFDEMHNTTLYHLNAYTYTDPAFNPDFPFDDPEIMKMWGNVIGAVEGKAGEKWKETEKLDSTNIPFIDEKSIKHATDVPRRAREGRRTRSSCT